jgi:DNA polymerase-3 subunit gamma/tau
VGQEHITQTLDKALKTGKLSHAYLFTGPRGVGKTSVARILAHEVNNLPYTDETTHLDIIEIDAASNRRIDEIRDIREKVHIAPASAKYKIYIIDEVHMLTKEAFNALLKTLEEPPAHVIFILATTELHKLPETIISRTQRFTFKPIKNNDALAHLRSIAAAEGMQLDDAALLLLAEHANGSFRDSISLLDQVGHSAKLLTKQDIEQLIGIAANEQIVSLYDAVTRGSSQQVLLILDKLKIDGIGPGQIAKQLAKKIRLEIIKSTASEDLLNLLSDLLSITSGSSAGEALEIVLLRANLRLQEKSTTSVPANEKAAPLQVTPATKVFKTMVSKPKATKKDISHDASWWQEVLQTIKQANNTLYGVMRMAEPRLEHDTLHLAFQFDFHKNKLNDPQTQSVIKTALLQATGKDINVTASVKKPHSKVDKPQEQAPSPTPPIVSITNIFGGGEVLEV